MNLKFSFILILFLGCQVAMSQPTKSVTDKRTNEQYEELKSDPNVRHGAYQQFYHNKKLQKKGFYKNNLKDSTWISFGYDGEIKLIENYKDGLKEGSFKIYDYKGQILSEGNYQKDKKTGIWNYYEDAKLIHSYNHDKKEMLINNEISEKIDSIDIIYDNERIRVIPEVNYITLGGKKAQIHTIAMNMRYPEAALDEGTEGTVVTEIILGKDGSIKGLKTVRGIGNGLDEESSRVVRLLAEMLIPARYKGEYVDTILNIPIRFRLSR